MTVITPEILEQALAQYFGMPADQVKPTFERLTTTAETVEQLQPMVVSQWREKEMGKLKESWGDEFDDVYNYIVNDVFPTLPPGEQAKWNNADGLKFLAEQNRSTIEQRITSKDVPPTPAPVTAQNQVPGTIAPANSAAPTASRSAAPVFKQSHLLNMSPAEWKENESLITQAYANGAVEMDVE